MKRIKTTRRWITLFLNELQRVDAAGKEVLLGQGAAGRGWGCCRVMVLEVGDGVGSGCWR